MLPRSSLPSPCAARTAQEAGHSVLEAPGDALARTQRDELIGTEWVVRRDVPCFLDEGEPFLVLRQAVEIRPELGCESLQAMQRARGFEGFGVELDARVGREDPGASAG